MTKHELALAQVAAATTNPEMALTTSAIAILTGLGRSAIYERSRVGAFPKQCRRGRWRAGDVTAWLRGEEARGT